MLSRADIVRLMEYSSYVDAVEAAFRAAVEGRAVAPPASALHVPSGSFHAKGAALLGDDAKVAIKLNGNFPGNPAANGLPTVQGIIYLADGVNGRIQARAIAAAAKLPTRSASGMSGRSCQKSARARRGAGYHRAAERRDLAGRVARQSDIIVATSSRRPSHARGCGPVPSSPRSVPTIPTSRKSRPRSTPIAVVVDLLEQCARSAICTMP